MKRTFIALLCLVAATAASAQQYMRIWQAGNSERVALQD